MKISELEALPLKSITVIPKKGPGESAAVRFSIGWTVPPEVMDLSAYRQVETFMRNSRGQHSVTIEVEAPVDSRGEINLCAMSPTFDVTEVARRAGVDLGGGAGKVSVSPAYNHLVFVAGFSGALESLARMSAGKRKKADHESAVRKKLSEAAEEMRGGMMSTDEARVRFIMLALEAFGG